MKPVGTVALLIPTSGDLNADSNVKFTRDLTGRGSPGHASRLPYSETISTTALLSTDDRFRRSYSNEEPIIFQSLRYGQ